MRSILSITAGSLIAACFAVSLQAADWPRFRGPDGSGASAETGLPSKWSDAEGILWKLELPGPGSSSPIVSKGKIFLTCYSGYGLRQGGGGDPKGLRRHVVCIDQATGKLRWDKTIESDIAEARFEGIGIPNHGYASSTPAADGERVVAYFGTAGVVAFDFEGKELWRQPIATAPRTHNFGSASSPVLYKDLVIVPAGIECESIVAFDKRTGKEAWRAPAEGYGSLWGTPVIVDAGGDRKDLVMTVPGEIWGMNPENGKLRWHAESSISDRNICTSIITDAGVAYAIGGRQGGAVAVKLGGKGDVTGTHIVWKNQSGSYVTSPVQVGGNLCWVSDRGLLFSIKSATGEPVLEPKRLGDSLSVYASLVAADGKLYAVTRRKGTLVLEARPPFNEIAANTIASDDTDFNASPAVSDGKLYLRSNRSLYCIGKAEGK